MGVELANILKADKPLGRQGQLAVKVVCDIGARGDILMVPAPTPPGTHGYVYEVRGADNRGRWVRVLKAGEVLFDGTADEFYHWLFLGD